MAPPTPTGEPRAGERGYTLAVVIGILTVMAILLAAALPHWSAAAQREREAELIARGFQYAEAIRVFQRRFGRLPNRLEELIEAEPRSIRQLWEDPFGDDGGWLVLMEGPGGQLVTLDPETGELVGGPGDLQPPGTGARSLGGLGGAAGPGRQPQGPGIAGPIHGVKSRADREAYHVLFGLENVGQWEFTVERLVAATSALAPDGLPRRAPASMIGRPFRYPPPGGVPGSSPQLEPGSAPGSPQPPNAGRVDR
jgi:type II secretory pathway pseudopilin PulG